MNHGACVSQTVPVNEEEVVTAAVSRGFSTFARVGP